MPKGPPANTLNMGSILPKAPPALSKTMPACLSGLVGGDNAVQCGQNSIVHVRPSCLCLAVMPGRWCVQLCVHAALENACPETASTDMHARQAAASQEVPYQQQQQLRPMHTATGHARESARYMCATV